MYNEYQNLPFLVGFSSIWIRVMIEVAEYRLSQSDGEIGYTTQRAISQHWRRGF